MSEVDRLKAWLEEIARQPYLPAGTWAQNQALKALAGETFTPPPPIPEPVCSKCGNEDGGGGLFTIQVITNEGEEGFSDVTMYLCEGDLWLVLEGIKALGFLDHTHGGTAVLQDDNCPGGYKNCPTPTYPYAGTYIIGNYELSPGKPDEDV